MTLRPYKTEDGETVMGYKIITEEEMNQRRLEVLKPEKTREAILRRPTWWRRFVHSIRRLWLDLTKT